jgi:hypothetical protein
LGQPISGKARGKGAGKTAGKTAEAGKRTGPVSMGWSAGVVVVEAGQARQALNEAD